MTLREIQQAISKLSEQELVAFADWFERYMTAYKIRHSDPVEGDKPLKK